MIENELKSAIGIYGNKKAKAIVYPVDSKITGKKAKCPDCDADLDVPYNIEKNEIGSCPGCGLELEAKEIEIMKDGGKCVSLQELTIEGEDWGE
jgi:hypothetical protein